MNKLKVGVLFGGNSSEYSVSLHSTGSLLKHFPQEYDLIMIGISEKGEMYLYDGSIGDIENDKWCDKEHAKACTLSASSACKGLFVFSDDGVRSIELDVIFPMLHGKNGEDGTIQGLLKLSGIPFVGCNLRACANCMDKDTTHVILEKAGLPCAPYICVYENDIAHDKEWYLRAVKELGLPFFVKPSNAGSSYGISVVHDEGEFIAGLKAAFYHDGYGKTILEKKIGGFEIGCAIMGNEHLVVGELDEIEIKSEFFDFEGKYQLKDSKIYCPARIDKKISDEAKVIAQKAYRALNCEGLARVDMFVDGDKIVINEVNTMPGFTATSRFPSMMKQRGIVYQQLIRELIELAIQ